MLVNLSVYNIADSVTVFLSLYIYMLSLCLFLRVYMSYTHKRTHARAGNSIRFFTLETTRFHNLLYEPNRYSAGLCVCVYDVWCFFFIPTVFIVFIATGECICYIFMYIYILLLVRVTIISPKYKRLYI
jgi:hypothetical protein